MIQALNTVQDLATTSGVTEGTVTVTSGFKTMGDGGGGNFVWKTVATYGTRPAADGGIIVYNSDTSGWWEREFQFVDVRFWGGKGDVMVISDGAMTASSNVLTTTDPIFTANDIGKTVYVVGAANTGTVTAPSTITTLTSTITAYTSATQVTLANNASATVSGTSVTFGTDSTNAFQQINLYLRSLPNRSGKIEFQSGTYMTNYNNWLAGIKAVEVIGNGANVMCTRGAAHPSDFTVNLQALGTPTVFDIYDNGYYGGSTTPYFYGYKFAKVNTAVSGDPVYSKTQIAVTEVFAANGTQTAQQVHDQAFQDDFQVGSWVLLWGFDHEVIANFPPDSRYYEYAQIAAVDVANSIITLDRNMNYYYDEEWPDYLSYVDSGTGKTIAAGTGGAPRIISCNRPEFKAIEDLCIRDLNFVPFTGWVNVNATAYRNGRLWIYGYIDARVINVSCTGAYPGQGKNLQYENCRFSQLVEPDKLVDQLTFLNCSFNGTSNAGGINFIKAYGCTFSGDCNLSPRYLDIDNCTFSSTSRSSTQAIFYAGFNKGVEHLRLGTNVWNCNDPSRVSLLANPGSYMMPVDAVISNTEVTVTVKDWIDNKVGRNVMPGSIGYTTGNKRFSVTRVYVDPSDPTNVIVTGDFSAAPVVGDQFYFTCLRRVNIEGRQHKIGPYANSYTLFANESLFPPAQYSDIEPASDIKRMLLTERNFPQGSSANYRSVLGYAVRLVINVIKPYTGTDSTAVLKLLSYPSGTFTQTIDLKTAGTRIAEIGNHSGGVGADVLVNLDTTYLQSLRYYWQGASAGTLTGDATVLPIFQVYLEAFELVR